MIDFEGEHIMHSYRPSLRPEGRKTRDSWAERQRYYDKCAERGWVKLPVNGNVHKGLSYLLASKRQPRFSQFTAWEAEQMLVFGFASHSLSVVNDYTLTKVGKNALRLLNEALEHGETEHKVQVPCKVNAEWREHFRNHVW